MVSVISEIIGWASSKLKYWEQLALYKIMAGDGLDDKAYQELLHNLLIDEGLIDREGERAEISFEAFAKKADESEFLKTHVCRIRNLQNVNALIPDQCLPFGPALTVVFGANASGKSGYARVLGCAGFTRGEIDVIPDINHPDCSELIPSAEIELKDDSGTRCISYQPGQECIELRSLHVFDVKSVQEHLVKRNTFTFSPAGLSYLTRLAEVTDEVRKRLSSLVVDRSKSQDFIPLFQDGDSPIKNMVSNLNAKTDLDALKRASQLSEADESRISELDKKIAELKTKNIPHQITELGKTIGDLSGLRSKLDELSDQFSNDFITKIRDNINEFNKADSLAKKIGIDQFKTEYFAQTGTATWYDFVKAAKELAEKEQVDDKPYPQTDDRCLLCHQPLSREARELILKLWEFIEGEAQAALKKANISLNSQKRVLSNTSLGFFTEQAVSYRYLEEHDKGKGSNLVETISSFVEDCRTRVATFIKMIDDKDSKANIPDMQKSGADLIELLIGNLDQQLEKLRKADPAKQIEQLETELRTLTHKKVLAEQYPEIGKYVNCLVWMEKAGKAGGSTRPITLKYDSLFEQIVTGGYLKLFQDILSHLGKAIRVRVDTTPRKGETFRQLVLEADSESLPPGANPDTVLSEGEKRAVALSDFLTEVALDTGSAGIVLDDPVTSLDLEWSSVIASLLVEEAKRRQVIVFTHNLPFVYYLKNFSKDYKVDAAFHWIKRGDHDDQPGYVFANNSPALESSYKSTHLAEEYYKKAKDGPPAEQEGDLKQGFGALRTTYEWFIIYKLLGGVVVRFDERISPGRLKDIIWDRDLINKVMDKHESLSRYIEGHLHSDAYTPIKPTPDLLLQEIKQFKEIKNYHRELSKALG
jgi:hypothetical protein